MKTLLLLTILTHSVTARAQSDSGSWIVHPSGWSDSSAFHIMISGGGGIDFGGLMATATLTTMIGRNVIAAGCNYTSDGSFVSGPKPWLDIMGSGPPTQPEMTRLVFLATYGRRLTSQIAVAVGGAFIKREKNIKYNLHTEDGGLFSTGGSFWDFNRERDSYPAAVLSTTGYIRATRWMGVEVRGQVVVGTRETWVGLSVSAGLGNFPEAETQRSVTKIGAPGPEMD